MKVIYRQASVVRIQRSRLTRIVTVVCVLSLFVPSLQQVSLAITNDGYQGTSISGRSSVAIVAAPGGLQVNTLLGTMFLQRTDLRIPGRGLPIEIAVTYNSLQNATPGIFGNGWTFSYGLYALRQQDNSVAIQWGDGRRDLYRNNGGSYSPVNDGVFATLQQVTPSTLLLKTPEQIGFVFDLQSAGQKAPMKQMQDPNGNILTFNYDTENRLTSILDAAGRSISLAYTAARVTTITDSNTSPPRTIQYQYDDAGNQIGFTDVLGSTTTYSYGDGDRLTKVSDPLGVTDIVYMSTDAGGVPVTSVSRSSLDGVLLSQRSFFYDVSSRITTVTDLVNQSTTRATQYQYDLDNRLVTITDALGHTESRTYDSKGNLASITDRNGNTTQFTYDNRGNVLTTTDALSNTTTFTYDKVFSKITSVSDPNQHITKFTYDSRGNRTSLTDPLGSTTLYSYDSNGQLISRQNANHSDTTFTYDTFGNRTATTDPLGRIQSAAYDLAGNLIRVTDGNRKTTTYAYDAKNRRTATTYPDLTQEAFTYDFNDDLLSAVGPNTNRDFAYDANGQRTEVTDNRLSKTISYSYDGVGNRLQMTDPEGAVVGYEYDAAGRVSTLSRNGQLYGFTYDFDGRLTTQTFPNGVHASYHYDAANRLLNLVNQKSNNSVISSFAYQYDRAGKPLRLTLADSAQIAYAYDARNQLVRETRIGGTASYDHQFIYDRVGNRTRLDSDGKAIEYTYDSADELTLEVTGQASTSYAYDRNGNQVQKTSGTDVSNYSYDSRNLLTGFATSAMSASYLHDVFGQRVSKSVGAATTQYVYDGFDAIAEYDGSGAPRAQNFFAGGIDQNLARFSAGESLYYLTDGLGSVRNIVDGAEQSVNTYDYDAWGNFLSRIEGVANDYTFTGRQSDQESGLYYFRARMYDPAIGRFNGSDPFDSNSGRSLYAYVDNTPTAATDPLGRNLRNLVNDVLRIAAGLLFLWLAVLALGVVLTVVLAIAVAVIAENPPPDSQPPTGSNVASGDEKKDQYYACGVA